MTNGLRKYINHYHTADNQGDTDNSGGIDALLKDYKSYDRRQHNTYTAPNRIGDT